MKEYSREAGGPINHPEYYTACGEVGEDGSAPFEPVVVMENWGLSEGFYCGSAIKYILRAPYKGSERFDLEKALWCLRRASNGPPTQRSGPQMCGAMRVAQAWKLSGRLQRALEHIEVGSYGAAADELEMHLDKVK